MYNDSYDDYIRSVLGYPSNYGTGFNMMQENSDRDIEACYPEIYNIVYPMVTKACMNVDTSRAITSDMVEKMTNDIYFAIEGNDNVSININLGNDVGNRDDRSTNAKEAKNETTEVLNRQENREDRQMGRVRNPMFRDLIRILLIRELLRRRREHRPSFPGRPPMRPPFSGNRPPMMPRSFEFDYNDLYEY